jgi:hypothetical protein
MSVEQFVTVLQGHLDVLCIGLASSNPQVPGHILMPALADAMGRVLSKATASPDLALTLKLRSMAVEAFNHSLRQHTKAIQNVVPANGVAS